MAEYRDSGAALAMLKAILANAERGIWALKTISIQNTSRTLDHFSSMSGVRLQERTIVGQGLNLVIHIEDIDIARRVPMRRDSTMGLRGDVVEPDDASPSPQFEEAYDADEYTMDPSTGRVVKKKTQPEAGLSYNRPSWPDLGVPKPNPWLFENWNITAQGRYCAKHGLEVAQKAAEEACSSVGATQPTPSSQWAERKNINGNTANEWAREQWVLNNPKPKTPAGASPARQVIFDDDDMVKK